MRLIQGNTVKATQPTPLYSKPIRLHKLICPRPGCGHVVSVTEDRWLVPAIAAHIAVAHWPEGLKAPHIPQEAS